MTIKKEIMFRRFFAILNLVFMIFFVDLSAMRTKKIEPSATSGIPASLTVGQQNSTNEREEEVVECDNRRSTELFPNHNNADNVTTNFHTVSNNTPNRNR